MTSAASGRQRIGRDVLDAVRTGQPLALLVLDLDHFKRLNDSYGHPVGDLVLRAVGLALREAVRGNDVVGRVGGEEFCVLLPATAAEEAVAVAERLRSAVAGADWSDLELAEPVTVSIGVASAPCGEEEAAAGWRALFDAADLHLFSAKRSGRNRVRAPGAGASPDPDAGQAPSGGGTRS